MILTLNCPPKSKYTVGSNYLFEIAFEISLNQFIDFTRFYEIFPQYFPFFIF